MCRKVFGPVGEKGRKLGEAGVSWTGWSRDMAESTGITAALDSSSSSLNSAMVSSGMAMHAGGSSYELDACSGNGEAGMVSRFDLTQQAKLIEAFICVMDQGSAINLYHTFVLGVIVTFLIINLLSFDNQSWVLGGASGASALRGWI